MARRVERDGEAVEVMGRQARRREETRARLLEAARALTLERDVEAITIADITARADVGFGSFYNYFESKEAILEATTEREAALLQEALEELLATEQDVAVRLAVAVRYIAKLTLDDPMWRWLFSHSSYGFLAIRHATGQAFERDLVAGKRSGRFAFDHPVSAMEFVFGGMLAVFGAAVAGRIDQRSVEHAVVLVLRSLGVADAAALARRKLPPMTPRRSEGRGGRHA
jgi:AcrR family transcriptional regulator